MSCIVRKLLHFSFVSYTGKNLSMQIDVMKTGAAHSDTNAVTILVGNKSDLKDITT